LAVGRFAAELVSVDRHFGQRGGWLRLTSAFGLLSMKLSVFATFPLRAVLW